MSQHHPASHAENLIEALPFIQKFRGQTFVIKYGGSAMEDDHTVERLLRDVVFLEAVGINPVLVHGGGKAISTRMREAGLQPRFVNGLRVTDADSVRIVEEVLDCVINPRIVASILGFGGRASGVSGRQVFQAERLGPQPGPHGAMEDVGFVGRVTGVNLTAVEKAVHDEVVPVVSPLAADAAGQSLNVNADEAAAAVAGALKAGKMIYLSDVPGIMRDRSDPESLIPTVRAGQVAVLMQQKVIEGGMIPKVQSAVRALEQGVAKVHFIDGRIPHALLLEIFTNDGVGTEIVA